MYVMETKIFRECGFTKKVDEFDKDGKYKYKDRTVKIKNKLDCKECRKGCKIINNNICMKLSTFKTVLGLYCNNIFFFFIILQSYA
jgi:hypothetical protein